MNRYLLIALLLISVPAWGQRTPVDEHTSTTPTYTVVGNGLNYHNGVELVASNKAVKGSGGNYYVDEAGLTWEIDKNSRDITFTRDGIATTFGFDGMFWFNTATEAWTAIDSTNNVTPTQSGDSVLIPGLYAGVDVEIVSRVYGPQVDYIITDMSGWTPNPYGTDGVLAFWHELKSRGHGLKVDGVTWNGTDYTEGRIIDLTGTTKDWSITYTEAQDSAGSVSPVSNALIRAVNKDFFGEAVDATWLASATLPVTMHYDTISANISSNTTWSAGTTYMLAADITVDSAATLTIEEGVFVKFGTTRFIHVNAGNLAATGTAADNIFFTSCEDNTVGEDTSGDADCNGTEDTPVGGDWNWLKGSLNNTSFVLRFAHVRYGGIAAIAPQLFITYAGVCTVTVTDCTFTDTKDVSGTGMISMDDALGYANITFTGNLVDLVLTTNDANNAVNIFNNIDATASTVVSNNIILTDSGGAIDAGIRIDTHASGTATIHNNTIVNPEAVSGSGIYDVDGDTLDMKNNIVQGFALGFRAFSNTTHSYNTAYGCTTEWDFSGGAGTGDNTTIPSFATHADDAVWDTFEAYHLETGVSAMIDTGSDTAANLSLDDRHATDDGNDDTGTVDRGYHFVSGAAAARRIIITEWLGL